MYILGYEKKTLENSGFPEIKNRERDLHFKNYTDK